MLHVYSNHVIERFVAENLEEAKKFAKHYYQDSGFMEDEWDMEFEQTPDDKILSIYDEDADITEKKTAKEWAEIYGKGFLGSTEY